MTNPIVIRFPPHARLVEPKSVPPLTDAQWEQKWREGVARRIARKVYDLPVPAFLRKQA